MIIRGTVVKILHNGQKHYAVFDRLQDSMMVVRTMTYHPEEQKAVVDEFKLPLNEVRRSNSAQELHAFDILRQMVGIPLETEKPKAIKKAPTQAIGKLNNLPAKQKTGEAATSASPFFITHPEMNDGKPTDVSKIDDPTGMLNSIAKTLKKHVQGIEGIEFEGSDNK